jgi:dihydrofolate reductase
MRKVILYIAASLDSYIARENGDVDWLFADQDYGYYDFLAGIEITLMGNETYKKMLSFGDEFHYKEQTNYVFTKNTKPMEAEYVKFINGDIISFVNSLKNEEGKDIWLIGGGLINTIMLNAGIIDEMVLSIHPVILGKGIKLFEGEALETNFKLTDTKTFDSGLVQLYLSKK